jgi:hypothetical protein
MPFDLGDDATRLCPASRLIGHPANAGSSRSRSMEAPIETRTKLHELALELIRSVFPPAKGIRLVGVTLSNFRPPTASAEAELPFREI